jgi:hypothetical protein
VDPAVDDDLADVPAGPREVPMSVPIRSPDFDVLYPTQESFDRAMTRFGGVAIPRGSIGTAVAGGLPMSGASGSPLKAFGVSPRVAPLVPDPVDEAALLQLPSIRGASIALLRKGQARIISEHEGRVEMLLLTVPKFNNKATPAVHIDPLHLRHFASVMAAFGNAVKYVIVAAPEQRPALEGMATAAGVSDVTYVLSPHFNVSIWVQDAHVAMRDCYGNAILCEGVAFNRFEDMSVADDVAAQTRVRALQSDLYFQGGNVLGASDVTLIGRDYLFRNTERFHIATELDALQAFATLFRTEILGLGGMIDAKYKDLFDRKVITGYGLQPIFHIDMYVTRTGVFERGKEIVFLGRPAAAKAVTGSYSDVPEFDTPLYDSFFKETEAQLATRFEVRHLPLWLTFGNLRDPDKRQKFYNLTWNNAIVENDGPCKRVLLPDYTNPTDARVYGVDLGLRRDLQTAAMEAWRNLGFTVNFTDSMEDLAWGDGAVHCMTKVLCRSRPAAR